MFEETLLGPPGEIKRYWEGLEETMLYKPFAGEIDPSDTAPLAVHADGAPTNKADGISTINWGSQTAEGPTIEKKLVFTCVKNRI